MDSVSRRLRALPESEVLSIGKTLTPALNYAHTQLLPSAIVAVWRNSNIPSWDCRKQSSKNMAVSIRTWLNLHPVIVLCGKNSCRTASPTEKLLGHYRHRIGGLPGWSYRSERSRPLWSSRKWELLPPPLPRCSSSPGGVLTRRSFWKLEKKWNNQEK